MDDLMKSLKEHIAKREHESIQETEQLKKFASTLLKENEDELCFKKEK